MTQTTYKHLYSHFLKGHENKLHFAAHSHHFWPDIARKAHLHYWDDSAKYSDQKWDFLFSHVVPKAQEHIAKILHLNEPQQIVFAPNTHELLSRLLSLFLPQKKLRILTTNSEFHSFSRQISRLEELPEVEVTRVETSVLYKKSDHDDSTKKRKDLFLNQLIAQLQNHSFDLFFISHVFYDSGIRLTDEDLEILSQATPSSTIMVIDGYHGFCAIPTNLSKLEGKVFYLSGGYKYAQAGEGACFLVVPRGHWRPVYTGWFANFEALASPNNQSVGYAENGFSFFGATQDFSGLYRFNAVWNAFEELHLTPERIHRFVGQLQESFLQEVSPLLVKNYELAPLFSFSSGIPFGHFLTYVSSKAELIEKELKTKNIIIDRRGHRLRFGFGTYQDQSDIFTLKNRL